MLIIITYVLDKKNITYVSREIINAMVQNCVILINFYRYVIKSFVRVLIIIIFKTLVKKSINKKILIGAH